MVKIKSKVFKDGGSYAIRIPKALVDSGIFEENGRVYEFLLVENKIDDRRELATSNKKVIKYK